MAHFVSVLSTQLSGDGLWMKSETGGGSVWEGGGMWMIEKEAIDV